MNHVDVNFVKIYKYDITKRYLRYNPKKYDQGKEIIQIE